MKILRYIVVLGVAVALLPTPPPEESGMHALVREVQPSPPQVFGAALSAAQDLTGFCTRQPQVCSVAGDLAYSLKVKAKYSIRLLVEWANTREDDTGKETSTPIQTSQNVDDTLITHSIGPIIVSSDDDSQSTLRLDDLIPDWRGPSQSRTG